MKKIYEAFGKDKRSIIEVDNDYRAFDRYRYGKWQIGIKDFVMIGSINIESLSKNIDIKWKLNGLSKEDFVTDDITIIEPLYKQINSKIIKLNEKETCFDGKIELSKKAILLVSEKLYNKIIKILKYKKMLNEFNVRIYEGEKDLALKMVFQDKGYVYCDIDEDGFALDYEEHPDAIEYLEYLHEILEKTDCKNIKIQKEKEPIKTEKKDIQNKNFKIITGLTKNVEGEIKLDEKTYGSTDIGKIRENQEDAILLIKDNKIPKFKMLVVADGVGGQEYGEVASDIIIHSLKEWFENLNNKTFYYKNVEELKDLLIDQIEIKIQPKVQYETLYYGASTLVCAIIGKDNTLIANIGDSRAYITQKGKLVQISREDTAAQENLEKGKTPSKEAARFDRNSNQILQCIGMDRNNLIRPHVQIVNNKDYEMLLLFTDGVTDCLSDEDIAIVCRTTNKKELANKIVEKAISHDSIIDEENSDYAHLNYYIPGGKDNTTAAIYVNKNNEER